MKNVLTGIKECIEDNVTEIIVVGTLVINVAICVGSLTWGLKEYRRQDRRAEAIAEAICRTKSW